MGQSVMLLRCVTRFETPFLSISLCFTFWLFLPFSVFCAVFGHFFKFFDPQFFFPLGSDKDSDCCSGFFRPSAAPFRPKNREITEKSEIGQLCYVRSQILRLKTRQRLWMTTIVRKKARKPRLERQRDSGPVARGGCGARALQFAARPTTGCPSACLCVHLHGLGGARVVFPRPGSLWFWEA